MSKLGDLGYKHISYYTDETKRKMDRMRSGLIRPLFTSSNKEKEYVGGALPSDQIVIAARTGTGKSAKVIQDCVDYSSTVINPSYEGKLIILLDSWEMPGFKNVLRMTSRIGEVEVKALLDYEKRLTEERYQLLKAMVDQFAGLPIYMSTRPTSVAQWEENKKQAQGRFPNHTILNIFDHTRLVMKSNEKSEEELISQLMLAGMRIKNDFEMINIFISQLNRNIETNVSRDKMGEYTPVASDIFGSDAVFQCADIVMALHRPGIYKVEFFENRPTGYDPNDPFKPDNMLVQCYLKNRDGWTGNLLMKHNLAHNRIYDWVDEFTQDDYFSNSKQIIE